MSSSFKDVLEQKKPIMAPIFGNNTHYGDGKQPYENSPEAIRRIELDKLFSRIDTDADEKSEKKVRPKRLVDAMHDEDRAALVDSALDIVNMVREKAGLEKLDDLPRAQPGDTGGCVLARAFGIGASGNPAVSSSQIVMTDPKLAKASRELFGSEQLPPSFTLDQVIHQFDSSGLLTYDENMPAPPDQK